MMIADSDKYIHFLSKPYVGSTHDYGILKAEFPPDKDWFKNHEIQMDLGYQGFAKDYLCKKAFIPHKKPRNQELSEKEKKANQRKSKREF
ncbi:MAG: transposase family protein [Microscillaceae bacterium]|nr:transposase family protein [Microscillaceae bacterium]